MNGVTILNTIHESNVAEIVVGIVFALVSIVCLAWIVHIIIEERDCYDIILWVLTVILIAALLFGVVAGILSIVHATTVDEIAYEITIDENVSFKEFNEKYEIVEQRGDIYVVKEIDK